MSQAKLFWPRLLIKRVIGKLSYSFPLIIHDMKPDVTRILHMCIFYVKRRRFSEDVESKKIKKEELSISELGEAQCRIFSIRL